MPYEKHGDVEEWVPEGGIPPRDPSSLAADTVPPAPEPEPDPVPKPRAKAKAKA